MIINGASRRSVSFWTRHLQEDKKNTRAEVKEIRGLGAESLRDALLEMEADATHTRCKNFMYQANFSPTAEEILSEQEWERAFEIFEQHRGIPEGQARVVVEHEKEGRIHRHVIWSRVDLDKMKAWPDALDAKVCHEAAREISEELGLHRSKSPYDKEREGDRAARHPKHWEMFRGMKSGLDPRDITSEVTAIYRESMNAADFVAGLQAHDYQLARGDRRNFCILDSAGDVHSLARRLEGVNSKELKAYMSGIDVAHLPSIAHAKGGIDEKKLMEQRDDLAEVAKEIAWEEALAKAGIEKEKIERRFVEPSPRQKREDERQEKIWPLKEPTNEKTKTSPQYHFEDAARSAGRDKRPRAEPKRLSWATREIWQAFNEHEIVNPLGKEVMTFEHDPDRLRDRLREKEIRLACVTKDEAEKSHRQAEFARAVGDFSPRYKEGEIVAVTVYGSVFRLTERLTGRDDRAVRNFFKSMDRTGLEGLEETKRVQAEEKIKPTQTERMTEVQAFRDQLRDVNEVRRFLGASRATGIKSIRTRDVLRNGKIIVGRGAKGVSSSLKTLAGVANGADKLADGLLGMFDPVLTPTQKVESRIAEAERDVQSAEYRETSRFTASQAQAQRQEEQRTQERVRDIDRDR